MLPLRVLVADDHKLFRQGLIGLMKTRTDLMHVIGEASSGREAIELAGELKPDLVLMDLYMPEMDGLSAAREIIKHYPETSVVMLTSSEEDEHLAQAMRLGAAGYILKTLEAEELFDLVEAVSHGEIALTASMAKRLLSRARRQASVEGPIDMSLTNREKDVLELIAQGDTNAQIAEALCISTNTVKIHVRNILQKLHVENRTQAATQAIRRGLIMPGVSDTS